MSWPRKEFDLTILADEVYKHILFDDAEYTSHPAALDQACVDLIYVQKDGDGASLVNRIESRNGLHTLEHAEEIGLGSRNYTLISIDG